MRKFQDWPIKRKLTCIIMLASMLALFLASGVTAGYEALAQRRTMVRTLVSLADIIAGNAYSPLLFNDQKAAQQLLSSLRTDPHIVGACIYDKAGKLFARYSRDSDPLKYATPPVEPDGYRFSGDSLLLFHKISTDGHYAGAVFIQSDLEALHFRLRLYGAIA